MRLSTNRLNMYSMATEPQSLVEQQQGILEKLKQKLAVTHPAMVKINRQIVSDTVRNRSREN